MTFDAAEAGVLGHHAPRPCRTVTVTDAVCVLTAPAAAPSPASLPLHGPPYSPRHDDLFNLAN